MLEMFTLIVLRLPVNFKICGLLLRLTRGTPGCPTLILMSLNSVIEGPPLETTNQTGKATIDVFLLQLEWFKIISMYPQSIA